MDEEDYQSLRIAPDGPITRIEVFLDEDSGQKVVFWDDIEFQFPGIRCVKNGDIAISFARDSKRRRIEPLCIKYQPGIILDVILTSQTITSNGTPHSQHSSNNSDQFSTATVTTTRSVTNSSNDRTSQSQGQELAIVSSYTNLSINTFSCGSDKPVDSSERSLMTMTPDIDSDIGLEASGTDSIDIQSAAIVASSPPSPPGADVAANQLVPQIQSTLETSAHLFGHFEQSIKSGQLHQAESIKQEIRTAFIILQSEMAKNQELQLHMLELQQTAADMQQRMMHMQQQALDRLAVIQSRVQAVLTQTYELHEYPIPRLFIVLPKETQRRDRIISPFSTRFRLYFLCECGEHTKGQQQHQDQQQNWSTDASPLSASSGGSRMASHHIHLAKHEGYDLDRPNEFFRKYGSHILTLLQMLKYGIIAAGILVPPLAQLGLIEGIDKVQSGMGSSESALEPKVDLAIQYLEAFSSGLIEAGDGANNNNNDQNNRCGSQAADDFMATYQQTTEKQAHELEALEGADLRHLRSFLKFKDESKILGNLYRIVTNEGHVKWVCLDHYRENYRDSAVKQFKDAVAVNGGFFDDATGKVQIRLSSSSVAKQFFESLEKAKFIQELEMTLCWETTLEDLRMLRDTMKKSNVISLTLDLCNTVGPSRDILNRSRRYDPILQMMANTKLHIFSLKRCDGFWSRLTKSMTTALHSSPSSSSTAIQLRALSIQGAVENWKTDQHRLDDLIRSCPRLTELKLQCLDIDATFEVIKNATQGFHSLRVLHLTVNQFGQQEQVDITIAQPQAEISSIIIESNQKQCTNLVNSGLVEKLVLYYDFDLRTQPAHLKRIVQENKNLAHLETRCMVQDFVSVFAVMQDACGHHASLKYLELQDNCGRNKVVSETPHDPQAIQLHLTGFESTGREEILRAFGWALREIPLGFQLTTELAQGLEEGLQRQVSVLRSIHANITNLTEPCLDSLARVIQLTRSTLQNVDILVWQHQVYNQDLSTMVLAQFIIKISSQVTRLNLHAYNMSKLLSDLAIAAIRLSTTVAPPTQTQVSATMSLGRRVTTVARQSNNGIMVEFPVGTPVARSATTIRKPAAVITSNTLPLTMPMLQELELLTMADRFGKMTHCQINNSHLQWLLIPLSAPSLRAVKLGYMDILTDGWTAVLQNLHLATIVTLNLKGMNIWDGQVRVLIECLTNAQAKVEAQVQREMKVEREWPNLPLKELTIEGSLITEPVLAGLEAQVHRIVPGCRVAAR
ncbi:hypothetical protein BGZ50_009641 [Haplosporangium sp. Z 11]|nr:hypothetical protein BGZ50_009641 [Haplosporangium sp. Z 11]